MRLDSYQGLIYKRNKERRPSHILMTLSAHHSLHTRKIDNTFMIWPSTAIRAKNPLHFHNFLDLLHKSSQCTFHCKTIESKLTGYINWIFEESFTLIDNERWFENQIKKESFILCLKSISNFWAKKLATLVQSGPRKAHL